MKVYVMTDMEGVSGISQVAFTQRAEEAYDVGRRLPTAFCRSTSTSRTWNACEIDSAPRGASERESLSRSSVVASGCRFGYHGVHRSVPIFNGAQNPRGVI